MKYLLCFLFIFTSCSYRDVILKKAPDFLSEKIDDYLSLDDEQEKELRIKVTNAFFEHHKEVLKLKKLIENYQVEKDSLKEVVVRGYPPYERIMKKVNKISIEVLSNLSFEQRQKLVKKRIDDRKDYDESYEKRGVRRLENIFGKLSVGQVKLVDDFAKDYKSTRVKGNSWHHDFLKALNLKDQKAYQTYLKKNFQDIVSLNEVLRQNKSFFKFFDKFSKSLSKEQIDQFNRKRKDLLNWIDLYLKIYQTPIVRSAPWPLESYSQSLIPHQLQHQIHLMFLPYRPLT
ncbi:hypothetical protein [Bacteriovorax sp. BAL6_X]|uniref:hypothetical protein n=1 Tax=Bacteriovorax sp. BAL6_X TaxID=1201290 RepID=UPI0012EE5DE9|nr:hypothetical protein [Bacteriovorax sp. BAL6_X]